MKFQKYENRIGSIDGANTDVNGNVNAAMTVEESIWFLQRCDSILYPKPHRLEQFIYCGWFVYMHMSMCACMCVSVWMLCLGKYDTF